METTEKKFRVVEFDETQYWNYKFKGDDTKVFGRYIYNPEEHTYCCSGQPSYKMHFLGSEINRESTETEECIIAEADAQTEEVCYMDIYNIKVLPYMEVIAENLNDAIEYVRESSIVCDKKD